MQAIAKNLSISPRKGRRVADLIRGLSVAEATAQLLHCPLKAAALMKKTLDSAVANASQRRRPAKDLYLQEVRVDGGMVLKRARYCCRGRRAAILKRRSHFRIALAVKEEE